MSNRDRSAPYIQLITVAVAAASFLFGVFKYTGTKNEEF